MIKAKFYVFKESGKYYTDSEGFLPEWANKQPWLITTSSILIANNGRWPGLCTDGRGFTRIIIPENGVPFLKGREV